MSSTRKRGEFSTIINRLTNQYPWPGGIDTAEYWTVFTPFLAALWDINVYVKHPNRKKVLTRDGEYGCYNLIKKAHPIY